MAGGYQVGIASETKAFKQGVEAGIIEPLEDAQKELVELGKSKGPDQLEKGLRDAERATDKLKDETQRTARAIEQEYKDAYRKTKQSSEDATRSMEDGFDDVKQEAEQSAKETFASFDGSFESIIDMGQEVAAQAFAGFGPAGLAAGLLAAGGIGLATSAFQAQQEQVEQLKSRLAGLYQEAIDSGREYIDQTQFIAESNSLRFDPERAEEWKNLQADANTLGIEQNTIIAANAGDLAAQEEVQRRINDLLSDKNSAAYYTTQRDGLQQLTPEMQMMQERWRLINEVTAQNAQNAREARESNSAFLFDMISGAETAGVEIDELNNKLIAMEDGKQVLIEADTGLATTNVEKFKGDADGVIDHINGRQISLSASASVSSAEADLNRLWSRWNGREVRIHGKVVTNGDGWNQ